jgi:carboxymethylenebutenolidase
MPDTTIPVPGTGSVPAYFAPAQDADGPAPGVVVVHEAFGLNQDIRRIADDFAARGYHALAPDLLSYAGRMRCLVQITKALSSGQGRSFDELEAARAWLAAREDSNGNVGIAGFCLGGAFALLMATRGFDASAAQYGRLPQRLESAFDGACPVVASYGGKDRSLTGAAQKLDDALTSAGVRHDVKEYAEAGHSFMNRTDGIPKPMEILMGPVSRRVMHVGYVDTAADDAWTRIDALFTESLR